MTKSFSSFFLLLVLSGLVFAVRATELTDLGEGLSYLRVHNLEESAKGLTAAIREHESLVLDLRHVTVTADSAELLRTAFKAREAKTPVFVLVGPSTPPALAEALMLASGKWLTLGVKESVPTPQVVVDQPADTDRRAYEALEAGQPLADLISGKISKERYDEAALMKEFTNANSNASSSAAPDSPPKPVGADKAPPPVTTPVDKLIDRVLQRAVHLQRALAAIKQR